MAENNRSVMIAAVEDDIYVDDSLSWEVVDPSDDDSDFSYDSSVENELVGDADLEIESKDVSPVGSLDSDVSMQSLVEQIDLHSLFVKPEVVAEDDEMDGGESDDDVAEEDDDDNDVECDLDDELVPKWVNDRFERQRMRKLGKRAYPKMNKAKRLPYLYNRPGCVRGKHGLGLKHSLM